MEAPLVYRRLFTIFGKDMGENIEPLLTRGAHKEPRKKYEPITVGGIILVLSIKELLAWAGLLGLFGIVAAYRQVGGGSKECGRDAEGNPRYKFRVKVERAEKEK